MFVSHLTCFACGSNFPADQPIGLCTCGKPIRVDYDFDKVRSAVSKGDLATRRKDLWRYLEVLPIPEGLEVESLGEGGTPLVRAPRLANELHHDGDLLIKDESVNPTGSFKARGMAVAVAMAKHFGATKLAVPSAGNAGGALAAYAALWGLEAHIFMPGDVPTANILECEIYGANVTLVDGLISDCAKIVMTQKDAEGWTDLSTLKEPYRIEGKKTMGYEICEQLGWEVPEAIIYPTGGGTGLIGMWKAFGEMEALGWIGPKRPKMFSVQAEGCAPIVRGFEAGSRDCGFFENASTVAAGLRVPRAIGDFVMMDLLRESGGAAIAVSDQELISDALLMGKMTGISACPEGGATVSALRKLRVLGRIDPSDRVVLFNTGSGTKYQEAFRLGRG